MTLTIVSGAAPGVEQGAIEAAVNLALTWRGRASSEHIAALPAIYRTGLQSTSAADPGMVRRINCQDADGALVFSTSMVLAGIPAFVDRVTEQMGRAFLHVTLNPAALSPLPDGVRDHIRDWIRSNEIGSVYVTGPSADNVPGIQGAVRDALIAILEPFAVDEIRETTRVLGLIEEAQPDVAMSAVSPDIGAAYRWTLPTRADVKAAPIDPPSLLDVIQQVAADLPNLPERPPMTTDDALRQVALTGDADVRTLALAELARRASPGPPEGLDEVQRRQLDASIREADRDIRGSSAVHWHNDPEHPEVACQYDGYGGVAQVKASPNRAEVTCADCRTWFVRYPQPPAPGDQTE